MSETITPKKSLSLGMKCLLALIILSFFSWGVQDVLKLSDQNWVAKVDGESVVTPTTLQTLTRSEVNNLRQIFGNNTLMEDKLQTEAVQQHILAQLIHRKLLEKEMKSLFITIGSNTLVQNIQNNIAFANEEGVFDKRKFDQLLQSNHLSETEYVKMLKNDLAIELFTKIIATQKWSVPEVAKRLSYFRNEKRLVEVVTLPANAFAEDLPAPSLEALTEYYKQHQEQFMLPEYRTVEFLTVGLENVLKNVAISDSELATAYQEQKEDFLAEEERDIEQLIFSDEASLLAALEPLKAGESFKKISEKNPDIRYSSLVNISKKELPNEIQEVSFSLKKHQLSAPIKTPFGWHLLKVTAIIPSRQMSISEVTPKLREMLLTRKAEDALNMLITQIEDEFGGGASLEQVAKKFDLTRRTIATVDKNGNAVSGEKVVGLPKTKNSLELMFTMRKGENSSAIPSLEANSYYFIKVAEVQPPSLKPFDQVKGEITALLQQEIMTQKQKEFAESILKKIALHQDYAPLLAAIHASSKEIIVDRPLKNKIDSSIELPLLLLEQAFLTPLGQGYHFYDEAKKQYMIATPKKIFTNRDSDKAEIAALQLEAEKTYYSDVMELYLRHLKNHAKIQVKSVKIAP